MLKNEAIFRSKNAPRSTNGAEIGLKNYAKLRRPRRAPSPGVTWLCRAPSRSTFLRAPKTKRNFAPKTLPGLPMAQNWAPNGRPNPHFFRAFRRVRAIARACSRRCPSRSGVPRAPQNPRFPNLSQRRIRLFALFAASGPLRHPAVAVARRAAQRRIRLFAAPDPKSLARIRFFYDFL